MHLFLQMSKFQETTSYFDENAGRVGVKSDTVSKLLVFLMQCFPSWSEAEIKCTVHVALSINQFNMVQQIRQQALGAYCPNIYTLQQQYVVVAQYCSTFRVRILDSRLFRFTLSVGCSLKSKGVFIVGIGKGKLVFQGNYFVMSKLRLRNRDCAKFCGLLRLYEF